MPLTQSSRTVMLWFVLCIELAGQPLRWKSEENHREGGRSSAEGHFPCRVAALETQAQQAYNTPSLFPRRARFGFLLFVVSLLLCRGKHKTL